jgi:hypothetical protein
MFEYVSHYLTIKKIDIFKDVDHEYHIYIETIFNNDMLDEVVVHAWYTCGHGYNVYNQINIRPKLM